jgi:hypothetical protein
VRPPGQGSASSYSAPDGSALPDTGARAPFRPNKLIQVRVDEEPAVRRITAD